MIEKLQKSVWFPLLLSIVVHGVLLLTLLQVKVLGNIFFGRKTGNLPELERIEAQDKERRETFIDETSALDTPSLPPEFGGSRISGLEWSDSEPSVEESDIPPSKPAPEPLSSPLTDERILFNEERKAMGPLLAPGKQQDESKVTHVDEKPGIPLSVLRRKLDKEALETDAPEPESPAPAHSLPGLFEGLPLAARISFPPLPPFREQKTVAPLEGELDVALELFEEPATGETFFRLTARVRPESELRRLPKDNLFLVDASNSVSDEELRLVFRTLKQIIPSLPEGDRYNVILFHMREINFSNRMLTWDEMDMNRLENFLKRPDRAVLTNLSNTLRRTLKRFPGSPDRPMNVIVFSDGKVTAGKSSVAQVTSNYSNSLQPHQSVFTYNIGRPVEVGLLKMMTFLARGYYGDAPRLDGGQSLLRSFAHRFNAPLLMNCEAQYLTPAVSEVYPRQLPNIYRDNTLRIYGKCERGEEFVLRLKARGLDGLRDILVRTNLPEPQDKPEIAREWARGRIYQLSEKYLHGGGDENVLDRIRTLSVRYGIDVPFDVSR
ncbi:MAG: VWA domain-containing protein [Planctomycetota bacterium]|nr:VWA domain-containing protein [Planctomycetota bacterium]